jgi:sporulation protein YlmC with PRC-barrel domain
MHAKLKFVLAAFTVAAVCGLATVANADDKDQVNVNVAQVLRSGDIIGLNVKNKAGENIGSINDLVIDMKSGEVRYAALHFGGFAGLGGKLFAVPMGAMSFKFGEPNKADSRHFVFDVSKEQLESAPGFDTSVWPNIADPKWGESVDKHYKVERNVAKATDAGAPVTYETVFRASKIKGMDVRNNANENLGSIDELVIDMNKHHVKYAALSFGSVFTGGNKLFAVPLSALTLNHANNKTFFVIHVSQDTLKNAPGFEKNQWPNMADPNWAKSIDTFYERTAARPATRQ